jgi:hypothetical protein
MVQPRFPIPNKSHNHKDYLPVGLLKLATWRKSLGDTVALSLGDLRTDFVADEVYVTSLFTYWSVFVKEAVDHYRRAFPQATITVGGVYASLCPDHCKEYTGCDHVHRGVHEEAEACQPDYSIVDARFQIVHASRGCIRRCAFCGTYEIEPEFQPKSSIKDEIIRNHVVFYDNNLLANPHISSILSELEDMRVGGRSVSCESQSGLDGRLLLGDPKLARSLKSAHFRNPRIAWDSGLSQRAGVRDQLKILVAAGYAPRDIQVFMLYNHKLSPATLAAKVDQCFDWGVQVADCRYRPLDLFTDGYNPRSKLQNPGEYYLHPGWGDADVRGLRRAVRSNNICIRYRIPRDRYNQGFEKLSGHARRQIAEQLGIQSERLSLHELDEINAVWLASVSAKN